MKLGPGTNLEDLDFKAIDKEMEADEVAQATVAIDENPSKPDKGGNDAPATYLPCFFLIFILVHFWVPSMFRGF